MKKIVEWSLISVQDTIINRQNSWELFGYDFMLDENYNTWLIEINSSPDLSYSTHITKELVKEAVHSLLDIVIYNKFTQKQQKSNNRTFKKAPPPFDPINEVAATEQKVSLTSNENEIAGVVVEKEELVESAIDEREVMLSHGLELGKWVCICNYEQVNAPFFNGLDLSVSGGGLKAPKYWNGRKTYNHIPKPTIRYY
jgi:hypothetical protein